MNYFQEARFYLYCRSHQFNKVTNHWRKIPQQVFSRTSDIQPLNTLGKPICPWCAWAAAEWDLPMLPPAAPGCLTMRKEDPTNILTLMLLKSWQLDEVFCSAGVCREVPHAQGWGCPSAPSAALLLTGGVRWALAARSCHHPPRDPLCSLPQGATSSEPTDAFSGTVPSSLSHVPQRPNCIGAVHCFPTVQRGPAAFTSFPGFDFATEWFFAKYILWLSLVKSAWIDKSP